MSEPIVELRPSAPPVPVDAHALLSEIAVQRSRIPLAEVMLEGIIYLSWAPTHWGLGEIDGLLVPPGKASNLLTDHLIMVNRSWLSLPRTSGLVKPSIHISLIGVVG